MNAPIATTATKQRMRQAMYLHVSIPLLLCFSFLLILGTLLPFTDAAANNNNKYNYLMTTAVQPNTDDLPLKNMFGMTVKKHGDTAVVGAFGASLTAPQAGAAYVYRRRRTATDNQEEWVYEATLLAEDGDQKDRFGFAVAVYENIIVVGSILDDKPFGPRSGSAHVFERIGEEWRQTAKLTASDGSAGFQFGNTVDIYENTIVVGSYKHNQDEATVDTGKAYIYEKSTDGTWQETAQLVPDDVAANDIFGVACAIHRDTVICGAEGDSDFGIDSGSAYVFVRNAADRTWSQQAKLLPDDGSSGDKFGFSVDVYGDTALVGAYFFNRSPLEESTKEGTAYIFVLKDGIWKQQTQLEPPDVESGFEFGRNVALGDGVIACGAHFDDSVYVFERAVDGTWPVAGATIIRASPFISGEFFGFSVDIDRDELVVGAYLHPRPKADGSAVEAGAVYFYSREPISTEPPQTTTQPPNVTATPPNVTDVVPTEKPPETTVPPPTPSEAPPTDPTETDSPPQSTPSNAPPTDPTETTVPPPTSSNAPPTDPTETDSPPQSTPSNAPPTPSNAPPTDPTQTGSLPPPTPSEAPPTEPTETDRPPQSTPSNAPPTEPTETTVPPPTPSNAPPTDPTQTGSPPQPTPSNAPPSDPTQTESPPQSTPTDPTQTGSPPQPTASNQPPTNTTPSNQSPTERPPETSVPPPTTISDPLPTNDPNPTKFVPIFPSPTSSTPPPSTQEYPANPNTIMPPTSPYPPLPTLENPNPTTTTNDNDFVPVIPSPTSANPLSPTSDSPPTIDDVFPNTPSNPSPETPNLPTKASPSNGDEVISVFPHEPAPSSPLSTKPPPSTSFPRDKPRDTALKPRYMYWQPKGISKDGFGLAVAKSGNFVLISAPGNDEAGVDTGVVYAYRYAPNALQWFYEATLESPNAETNRSFGSAVALEGDIAVVGTRGGTAEVFTRYSADEWFRSAMVKGPFRETDQDISVDISGDTIVVGFKTATSGAVVVLKKNSEGRWGQETMLRPESPAERFNFALSVAVDDKTIAVGGNEAVYMFQKVGEVWREQAKIESDDGQVGDQFGSSIDLLHSTDLNQKVLLVGASGHNANAGAAYIFLEHSGGIWKQETKFTHQSIPGDGFGSEVALEQRIAVVGAPYDDSLYVFTFDNEPPRRVTYPSTKDSSHFGFAMDTDGRDLIVGAFSHIRGEKKVKAGTAYLYTVEETTSRQTKIVLPSDTMDSNSSGGGTGYVNTCMAATLLVSMIWLL